MPGTLGGQRQPRRLLRAPRSPARVPGSRLPDGGRFLLSRLTARLNIAAVAPGGRRSSGAAEQEDGEEEEAKEEEPAQHRPGAPAPAPPPSPPPGAAWRARCALPARPGRGPAFQPPGPEWPRAVASDQTPSPGPAPGMACPGLEGARAVACGLGALPAHPGGPAAQRSSPKPPPRAPPRPSCPPGRLPLGSPTSPGSRPLPAASRNGRGTARAALSVAPCAFAGRQAGVPSRYTDWEAEASRFCKPMVRPTASPPRPRDPGSPRAFPPRDSGAARPSPGGESSWGVARVPAVGSEPGCAARANLGAFSPSPGGSRGGLRCSSARTLRVPPPRDASVPHSDWLGTLL